MKPDYLSSHTLHAVLPHLTLNFPQPQRKSSMDVAKSI